MSDRGGYGSKEGGFREVTLIYAEGSLGGERASGSDLAGNSFVGWIGGIRRREVG
jgi:hypothetical protein